MVQALLGLLAGALAGAGATVFLYVLDEVTQVRLDNSRLVWLLPIAAYAMGEAYLRLGGRAVAGKNLIIEHSVRSSVCRGQAQSLR
jgi:hypothetical protein